MNTKILLLSITLIFMFPKTIAVAALNQKQSIPVQTQKIQLPLDDNKSQSSRPMDWTFDWTYNEQCHNNNNHSDEDCKSYHFHYNRFCNNRKRLLVIMLLKLILVIAHVSSLLCASIRLMH